MAHSFMLKLRTSGASSHLYQAIVNGTREAFLILDEESGAVRLSDSEGNPTGTMQMTLSDGKVESSVDMTPENQSEIDDFSLMSAHLVAQWRRQGQAPEEIRKFFA
jgi:hypothetical protein